MVVTGADEVITKLSNLRLLIGTVTTDVVQELCKEGEVYAFNKVESAVYSGTNDVVVVSNGTGFNGRVDAMGNAIAFIEFGAGMRYPADHPQAGEYGFYPGSFSRRKDLTKGWSYYGTPGLSDAQRSEKMPGGWHTYGNPANKCMFHTAQYMRKRIIPLFREKWKR